MAAMQDNMICSVCTEVCVSPRFLPCYHTFCLACLEELTHRHGNIIPCPTCRAPATVPPGGVSALQVNFYFIEEALERARREEKHSMCSVHSKECITLYCTQCDQSICLKCKLTKHKGHTTENLSKTVARYKKTIEENLQSFMDAIESETNNLEFCKQNEKRAQEKRVAVIKQIQVRYDFVVAMAGKCRDEALQELQTTSDDLDKDLAADTQRVQDELNSLLQLQALAQRALSSACDTEVLQVEREIRGSQRSDIVSVRGLEAGLSDHTYSPVRYGDFNNYIEDHYMKTFIRSPVKQKFLSEEALDIVRVGRCGEGGCREVHALRQKEDGSIDVYYGGTGGGYSKEKHVSFTSEGCRGPETDFGARVSCVTRKNNFWRWKDLSSCDLGSKNNSMHSLMQNFATREFYICSMKWEQTDGEDKCVTDTTLICPKVNKAHNFDSNEQGTLFAVIDEEENENYDEESVKTKENKAGSRRSRVVRLYSNKSDDPISTYRKKNFFPTDVCFSGDDLLLIADWMSDCVHVTYISGNSITFIRYLMGSGDMVRPTALNLDLNGQLLIGCGDGWVLRVPVDC